MNSGSAGNSVPRDQFEMLEQEVFELEEYINHFWEFNPVPIMYVNPSGTVLDVDTSLGILLGADREALIGGRIEDYSKDQNEIKRIHSETLEKGTVKDRTVIFYDKQKNEIPVKISTLTRKDLQGEVIGYFASLIDLTVEKKLQAELEEKIDDLKEFNDLAVGRELKMIELEKEINLLLTKLGQKPRYEV